MVRKIKILTIFSLLFFGFLGATNTSAFSLGEKASFNIEPSYDYQGRAKITATLKKVGARSLFYVEDDWFNKVVDFQLADATIVNLMNEFDNVIYPRLTKVYGSEWNPGIDNESRLVILIAQMKEGTGGYFNSADEFFKTQISNSNEHEMIYLNSLYIDTAGAKGYLAHEFQHLINFYQKEKLRNTTEDIWLNEARSEYALTLCGYDSVYEGSHLERRINEFKRNPSDSLTEWQNRTEDYGPVNLFMQYFASRYGEKILTEMSFSALVGIAEIDNALANLGYTDRFADIYANWIIANYINDCQVGEGQKYCYLNPLLTYNQLHVSPNISSKLSSSDNSTFSFTDQEKDWAGHWYELAIPYTSGLNLIINFSGEKSGSFQVPYIIQYINGSKSVKFINLNSQEGNELILGSVSPIKALILMPISKINRSAFSASELTHNFSFTTRFTADNSVNLLPSPSPSPSPSLTPSLIIKYSDGSLVRAKGDYKVYVIKGGYKRWIQSAEIFSFYPHFGWQQVIEISKQELDGYKDTWLVRADGDFRVYEINGDLTKHWLNMTAEKFSVFGRKWDMIYIINKAERDFYKTGVNVLK